MSIKEKNGEKETLLSQKETVFPAKENKPENTQLVLHSTAKKLPNIVKSKRASPLIIDKKEQFLQNTQNKNSDASDIEISTNAPKNKKKQEAKIQKLKEKLQAKAQLLKSHINAVDTTNASVEFDLEGIILNANKNFLEIMGYSKKDLIGKHHRLLVDAAYSKSNSYQLFWTNLNKGIYHKDEFIRVAKNGKLIWFSGSYNPIFDTFGKPYKILKIATDITLTKTQFLQLAVQAQEKEKRASELIIANNELAFQNKEKEKRAAELIIANKELKFQNEQKEKRASELIIANKELAFQNTEKEKRAAELIIANKELKFQNEQKEKRASELIIANNELAFQNTEKENRAAELIIANKELKFQNEQKEKRASELIIANKELAIQSKEKEKRAAELIIANKKLASENILKEKRKVEKLKRAAELIVTNRELAYQEKRSSELTLANDELKKAQEELGSFSYSVSHDLRAPIRAINGYTQILIEDHTDSIDEDGKQVLQAIVRNSNKMGVLIDDLLSFSKLGRKEVSSANINMTALVNGVISEITIEKDENDPIFELEDLAPANGDASLIKQVWVNLISNAIKYSKYKPETRIKITSTIKKDTIIYSIKDWGAGFDMAYYD
jgi:PAS domain S-box-containing protein